MYKDCCYKLRLCEQKLSEALKKSSEPCEQTSRRGSTSFNFLPKSRSKTCWAGVSGGIHLRCVSNDRIM